MVEINDRIASYYGALEALASGGARRVGGLSKSEIERFGLALKNLQRGLTGDRRLAGASYFSEEEFLGAYLLYYWPVSYAQVSMALEEIRMRGALPPIRSALDMGAGPGPASFAAVDFGAERVILMDSSEGALDAARRLRSGLFGTKIEFSAIRKDFENDASLGGGPYDLIVACHSANELWKDRDDAIAKRASLFGRACSLLAEGGLLLIVEPSANATGRPALALRDRLLANDAEGELSCVAPCPGSYPCPVAKAGEGRGCHSTWPWDPPPQVAALAAEAGLDRDSAKATWFALKKTTRLSSGDTASPDRLAGRIISEPMLNKAGRLRYIICTAERLATLSAKSDDPAARRAGFFSLGRGDCVEVEAAERRAEGSGFGIAEDTRLSITLKAPSART